MYVVIFERRDGDLDAKEFSNLAEAMEAFNSSIHMREYRAARFYEANVCMSSSEKPKQGM